MCFSAPHCVVRATPLGRVYFPLWGAGLPLLRALVGQMGFSGRVLGLAARQGLALGHSCRESHMRSLTGHLTGGKLLNSRLASSSDKQES